MAFFDIFLKKRKPHTTSNSSPSQSYEFCPRCDANLTLQKGYSNSLPYWICKGCGEMLINPDVEAEDDIVWRCDGCGKMLNIQDGFTNNCGEWKCTECGYLNKIDASEIYSSEDELQASFHDPYKGLSDSEVLELSMYDEIRPIDNRTNVILLRNREDEQLYVKKYLSEYDISIYKFLLEHPITQMPRLIAIYEGSNNLVIIEEYIEGRTLAEILQEGCFNQTKAIEITKSICSILMELHNGERAIIHRDIKPSNVMITDDGTVFLLDINVAKWYKPEKAEDTRLYGTLYYAAPEQFGYGFSSSSGKTDIYAVGIMLNVMLTGKMPKEKKATGTIWPVIEKCISLEPENRYTAAELKAVLERL